MDDSNPFANLGSSKNSNPVRQPNSSAISPAPVRQAVSSPSVARPSASSSSRPVKSNEQPDQDSRFTVLVEKYRQEQEKNKGLRVSVEESSRIVEELSVKFKAAAEEAERSKFAHETLLKKCRSLQLQLKEEREQKAASSGSWFGGGQAAKDLERCKAALKEARGELRRKIEENENLVRADADTKEAHERAIQLLKDKIHGMGVELRMEEEKQAEREKRWEGRERELRAAAEEAEARRKTEEVNRRRLEKELADLGVLLDKARNKEREVTQELARVMREKIGFDDSRVSEWALKNAVSTGGEESWGDATERARWAEAACTAVRSLQGKARAMEAGWGSYAGGGPEDAAARQALRALLAWAGKEHEGECDTIRGTAGAVKRLALAMVSLRVRPNVREAGVEAALQGVVRALVALSAVSTWQSGTAHVLSGPRLARLAEKRLEGLREALKDARESLTILREKDGSRQPSGNAMENAVAAASAALAVVRAGRGRLENATADVRGQARQGPYASGSSFAAERAQARSYLQSISVFPERVGVPYERALELEIECAHAATEKVAREAALTASREDAKKAKEEGEALRHELAVLQDLARTQRGQLQRLAQQQSELTASSSLVATAAAASPSKSSETATSEAPPEGHYTVKVTLLGEREDLSSKWEKEEKERVAKQVAEAERLAQHWHGQYLALAMEAESTANSRKEMAKAKEDLQSRLTAFQDEKEALHRGYQEQLLLLNDHVIKQSEAIAQKDNEISVLLGVRIKCATCQNWNTLAWLNSHGNGKQCQFGNHPSGVNYAAPGGKK